MIAYSIEHLITRIARTHRTLVMEPGDIAAWCYEAMEDCAPYEVMLEQSVPIQVVNGRGQLPLNIFRLLSIDSGCGPCNESCYGRGSRCLNFPLQTNGTVMVNMLAFPSDDRGYPLIDDDFMTVCYWYCLKMLLMEPSMLGTISGQAYQNVQNEYAKAEARARGSFRNVTTDKMKRISRMLRSSVIASQFRLR